MKYPSYRDHDYEFGQQMLTLRSAMGLTQEGLAQALGISRRSVADWEAGSKYPKTDRLKAFIALAVERNAFPDGHELESIRSLWAAAHQKVLLDESWLASLIGVSGKSTSETQHRGQPLQLPVSPTPFVGRAAEVAQITGILANGSARLLTLVGPGGIGKTRLALEVAARMQHFFADGVVFVTLVSVASPTEIASKIGEGIGWDLAGQIDPERYLLEYLHAQHMLLILDNFEHMLTGVNLVTDLLNHASGITVLVTSRERLNLQAEWLFDVQGLSFPTENAAPQNLEDLSDYSAMELFVQRATQVQPNFRLYKSNFQPVVSICQQIAGMPLAIELAAANMRALNVFQIEREIRSNLDILTTSFRDMPPRHRSLRAVFDQSWNLLDESERSVFSRLSVFRGGCTGDAAGQVVGATYQALMLLVDKSLLRLSSAQADANAENGDIKVRFRLLEPLFEYALEKLKLRGEEAAVRDAHARYYLSVAQSAWDQWNALRSETWVEQLHDEHDNIRVALQWSVDSGNSLMGLQFTEALWSFWRSFGYISEGRRWLGRLLALNYDSGDPTTMTARRHALHAAAWLASDQHDYAEATQLFEQSIELGRILGETEDEIDLLVNAARQFRTEGEYQRATMLLEEALAQIRALGDPTTEAGSDVERLMYDLGQVLRELGLVQREQGNFARAVELFEEGVQLHEKMEDRGAIALSLLGLSDCARDQGDAARVRHYGEQSLVILRELGMQWAIGFTLNTLAQAAYLDGDLTQARALVEESISVFHELQADGSLSEVLVTQGNILRAQRQFAAAQETLTEAVRLSRKVGPRLIMVSGLEALANVMVQSGLEKQGAQALRLASDLRLKMGTPVRPADQPFIAETLAILQSSLGADALEDLWQQADEPVLDDILSV